MTFSQIWDACFSGMLIAIGILFVWLGLIEPLFGDARPLSVILMTLGCLGGATAFFLRRKRNIEAANRRVAEAALRRETDEGF